MLIDNKVKLPGEIAEGDPPGPDCGSSEQHSFEDNAPV
jgi:hypothetical protein